LAYEFWITVTATLRMRYVFVVIEHASMDRSTMVAWSQVARKNQLAARQHIP
jgi:hypothetical protein